MSEQLTLSPEVFHVKICRRQVKVRELGRVLDLVFSEKFSVLRKSLMNCHISSLRMSRGFCQAHRKIRGNGLVNFSGPWPKSGMMLNGFVYPLPALERHISGRESGLLPTPTKVQAPALKDLHSFNGT